jgi:tripartite-type tricarboxylate transporter receptor subunit TctC
MAWTAAAWAAAAAMLPLSFTMASAQQGDTAADYPNKNVQIIVAAPPGGGIDAVARMFADRLQKKFGRSFIVENRAGAGGGLATGVVANAEPDGYTLLAAGPAPLTTNVLLYKSISYDPSELQPLAILTRVPNVLAVRANLPLNSVKEIVAYAKANPGKLTYGSQGVGTSPHLAAELFAHTAGIKITHVPYRGTAAAVNDLVGGSIDMVFFQIDTVLELHQSKSVKILAVATESRAAALPDVPTLEEAGVPNIRSHAWNLFAVPAKTPAAIVTKLNQAINELLKDPEMAAMLQKRNMQPVGGTAEDANLYLQGEREMWRRIIQSAGITAK